MRLSTREKVLDHIVLIVFGVFAIIPLIGVLMSAVTPPAENSGAFALPSRIDLGNFGRAWTNGQFSRYMLSSLVVTVAVVVLTTVLAILASFAFARLTFRGSSAIFFLLLAGLMLPAEAFIIPLYFNLRSVGLTDTYASLILPQTAQSLAFATFWLRNQFRTFPTEIVEAARLDGARDFRLLWQVMVPPSLAPIMTMCVLITMWTWNEFLIPLVLIVSEDRRTAPLGLAFFKGEHLTDYSLLSAAGVIVALPIVILYFALQKRFISGMLGGIAER
ncbi:carbohydrate ABC transporter permease [Microlunatus ginsengisoli]|uniref:Carbohydrate ABC transporter permease n=1 Tax=Microlunatus ginsengisoli TaxID=363863 RepID=A0ABP7AAK2_9ACTN